MYRRWRTKRDLLAGAISAFQARPLPHPDTGTLRGDLIELIRHRIDDLQWRHATLGELGLQTRHDEELGPVVAATIEER